ncbi:MAG: hypothetical protein RL398_3228 [Planctomycetota bacterium]|jgi:hypothetical protein
MRLTVLASLGLAVFSSAQDPAGTSFRSKSAFREFLAAEQARGGNWIAQWHPATITPSAIYGTGLKIEDWRENSLIEARRHALAALESHRELLGLGTSEYREIIGSRMGRTWSFTFDQYFRGLPVIEGRADVRINMKGVIAMLGSRAFPVPADFDTNPAIDEQLATAIAWERAGKPTGASQPAPVGATRLVIWGDIEAQDLAEVYLAWEVPISNVDREGNGSIGRHYIDAKTGRYLYFGNDKHECGFTACMNPHHGEARTNAVGPQPSESLLPVPTTVTVQCWTRTGDDAYSALVNTPLRGVVVNVPGIGNVTTDANGQINIDIAAPVTISLTSLDGTHHAPLIGANAPSGSVTVQPGVNATLQLLSAAATANEAAHPTTSYWVDRSNEWARSILDMSIPSNLAALNTISGITPTVNIASTCNAYYTGNTINFYQAGGGCSNTAFSTVVAHEWGHGLDERFGGISNTNADGVSEGWGDIIGMYQVDSPLLGSGFQTANVALRRGDNTFTYPYSGSSPHAAGQVWMGFAWQLRQQLRTTLGTAQAVAISDDIVLTSIVADATTRIDAVREVFIADDDDGNLLNGVPHYTELSNAATIKAIPYPQIQVAAISHTALGNTGVRLTPRKVAAFVAPTSTGTINAVRLHYNDGSGAQVRNMKPNGFTDGYESILPGILSGSVSYHIEADHSSNVTVRLPETGEYTYVVTTASTGTFTPFYNANFDTAPAGWTTGLYVGTSQDWQRGAPAGKSGTSSGVAWTDPSAASSNGSVYGTDLGAGNANGAYLNNRSYYLRSAAIDCTGRQGVALRFRRWLTVEEGIYDQAQIYCNGILVWENQANGNHIDTGWNNVEYSLPMADNNASVTIEFRLTTDASLALGGWNVDDFELGERFVPPLAAELRMTPEQQSNGGTVNVAIKTEGPFTLWALPIGTTTGPTIIAGVPPISVGGNYFVLSNITDATGNYTASFGAPLVTSTVGLSWYSQLVTFDAAYANIVTSNLWINLFTQTP